jgi:hypothetical protein
MCVMSRLYDDVGDQSYIGAWVGLEYDQKLFNQKEMCVNQPNKKREAIINSSVELAKRMIVEARVILGEDADIRDVLALADTLVNAYSINFHGRVVVHDIML